MRRLAVIAYVLAGIWYVIGPVARICVCVAFLGLLSWWWPEIVGLMA